MDKYGERILEDANKLKGLKVTYSYIAFPTYSENELKSWYESVVENFDKAPGIVKTISYNTHNEEINSESKQLWKLPEEYECFQTIYENKFNNFLSEYGEEYESIKNSYVKSLSGTSYKKYFLTPYIEIENEKIKFFNFNLRIYENGTVEIELVEDLEDMFFDESLLTNFSFKSTSLYANRFKSKSKKYISKTDHDIINVYKSIEENLKVGKNKKISKTQDFYVYFLENADQINESNEIYHEFGIEHYLVNAPFINLSLITKEDKFTKVPCYDDEYIMQFLNKAVLSVVTRRKGMENLAALTAYFSSIASYHFQQVFLNEIKLEGTEKLKIENEKDILNFKQWLLKYRRLLTGIYRPNNLSATEFYNFLQKNTYFKLPDDLDEIVNEEMNIMQIKNEIIKEDTNRKMGEVLFIIGILSIVQVVEVFVKEKILLLLLSGVLCIDILTIVQNGFNNLKDSWNGKFLLYNLIAIAVIITIFIIEKYFRLKI